MGVPEHDMPMTTDVYESLQGPLRSFLRRRLNDPMDVEDALQEVFAKALAAIQADKAPRNLPGWLHAAARTTVIDRYRKRSPQVEYQDEVHGEAIPEEDSLREELSRCLRPLAGRLPARYADTLLRTEFDGRTMASVAVEDGLSVSAVKSRATRGRALLKQALVACCPVRVSGGAIVDARLPKDGSCSADCSPGRS
jgi:RNA polymerase sigma-70 factor (ECF subfamily)